MSKFAFKSDLEKRVEKLENIACGIMYLIIFSFLMLFYIILAKTLLEILFALVVLIGLIYLKKPIMKLFKEEYLKELEEGNLNV